MVVVNGLIEELFETLMPARSLRVFLSQPQAIVSLLQLLPEINKRTLQTVPDLPVLVRLHGE